MIKDIHNIQILLIQLNVYDCRWKSNPDLNWHHRFNSKRAKIQTIRIVQQEVYIYIYIYTHT